MNSTFTVGVDLGQAQDYTAVVVVEHQSAWVGGLPERKHFPELYMARHVERLPLKTTYPAVVDAIKRLMADGQLKAARLVVDATGVGAPVVDLLRKAGLNPAAVMITAGGKETRDGLTYHVPKRDLVGQVQVLLQSGKLKIADGLPLGPKLVQELLAFKVTIDPKTAHDSYAAWREGDHDDLVLALALACWPGLRGSGYTVQER
jgi:hypothetical protein